MDPPQLDLLLEQKAISLGGDHRASHGHRNIPPDGSSTLLLAFHSAWETNKVETNTTLAGVSKMRNMKLSLKTYRTIQLSVISGNLGMGFLVGSVVSG